MIRKEKEEEERVEYVSLTQSEAEKKLVRRMNWTFMPFVCTIVFFQFADKAILTSLSVMPQFWVDTGVSQDEYAWLGSLFYLGFFLMQLPNNYMMQKFPISKYLGTILVLWGLVVLSMAYARNFVQLAILRVLLGFCEAITYPNIFLLISSMYRRSEQVIWLSVTLMSNSFAIITIGFVVLGLMQIPSSGAYSSWKWTLIIFGSITSALGFLCFFFLPDSPYSRWFRLTEEEKPIVEHRIRDNAVVPTQTICFHQIREAVKEPRFYCICLISIFVNFQNSAITTFAGIIIRDMGFSSEQSLMLTTPGGLVIMISLFLASYISRKKREICLVAVGCTSVCLISVICLAAIPSGPSRLIGVYLSSATVPVYTLLQTCISNNVSGYTKKIFYTGANQIAYTIGCFIGPLLLRSRDAPRYLPGIGVCIGADVMAILLFLCVRYTHTSLNKKRNVNHRRSNIVALPEEIQDLTDTQNPHFVYQP
ncbi:major facilitator superfamily domain-containing protein [Choanephora cucurbitarum]|nr:major facilitator superfamily domain-containing protein [Choanephora cucurbitarum]